MEVEPHVGTSGWMYGWNPDGLEWYARETGFDAIELNMSFYRFPTVIQVERWVKVGCRLSWSIKVNRLITHNYKFVKRCYGLWHRFREVFGPMDGQIAFYLFQLPPRMGPTKENVVKLADFVQETGLRERFALEWRNIDWFKPRWVKWCEKHGITLVSIDSPEHPRMIFNTAGATYLRVHGREVWYGYEYSDSELEAVAAHIIDAQPSEVYVFFNNNHYMLANGTAMQSILRQQMEGRSGGRIWL